METIALKDLLLSVLLLTFCCYTFESLVSDPQNFKPRWLITGSGRLRELTPNFKTLKVVSVKTDLEWVVDKTRNIKHSGTSRVSVRLHRKQRTHDSGVTILQSCIFSYLK